MNERFRRYANFNAVLWDIMKDEVGDYKGKYDTVICINVLEHLKDDNLAIQKMKELLKPGGKLIIMVPALQKLYCSLDENVGHYRRYDKGDLQRLAKDNHLTIKKNIYFNQLGITYNKDGSENVSPANASAYADRTASFPYKIDENDLCYQLFKEHGFTWGGHWNSCKDYQHFQKVVE